MGDTTVEGHYRGMNESKNQRETGSIGDDDTKGNGCQYKSERGN